MRYQLENANKDIVNLKEELSFIQNYIAMEKERVGKRCLVEYNIEDKEMKAHQLSDCSSGAYYFGRKCL
jgi:LytS/YehU family sensor histidine kinase